MSREVMYALVGATQEHMTTNVQKAAPMPATSSQAPADFGQAVDIYRQNYVQYKTTGRAEYKTAYEVAETWIQQYLQSMRSRIDNSKQTITTFVNQQAGAGTELGKLGDKMKSIKKEGPASQDAYITIKRINEDVPQDNTNLYVKGAIAAALIGIAGIASIV